MNADVHPCFPILAPALERLAAEFRPITSDTAVAVVLDGSKPLFKVGAGPADVPNHTVVYTVYGDWKPGRCRLVPSEEAREVVSSFIDHYLLRHPNPAGRSENTAKG
jgi:hypothetical protein